MTRAEPTAWWIAASGRAYGPYPLERLASFAGEGRLDGATLVAREADGPYAPAQSEPRIAELLAGGPRRPDVDPKPDKPRPVPKTSPARPKRAHVVVAQFSSNLAAETFAATLGAPEDRVDAAPGVWLVRSDADASTLRNRLSRGLGAGERLIVIETAADGAAWFALDGEADRAMRRLLERVG